MSPQYMEKLGHVEVAPGLYGTWSSYESMESIGVSMIQ
jgi:hypothetical protein